MTTTTDLIAVTLKIDNIYEDGAEIQTIVHTEVEPPPSLDPDDWADWEQDEIFDHTGADYPEGGDAGYFVEVIESSDPVALPVGTKIEFC